MTKVTYILKKFLILSLAAIFFQRIVLADAKYDWASGYKIRSSESMDSTNYFKNQVISGGGFKENAGLLSTWASYQGHWAPNDGCNVPISGGPDCSNANAPADKPDTFTDTYDALYRYTCSGSVSYDLVTKADANHLVGGDTMYGAWSMLFSYFPPVLDSKSCSEFGRCFVGNAFILDTKAQNEESAGRLWGLGVKELVEGPGDVFYFDQVRAMTQPPKDTASSFNDPHLVGSVVPGSVPFALGECDGALFEQQLGHRDVLSVAQSNLDSVLKWLPELLPAYAAAQEATGIPCEILAGIHYVEGGMDPTRSLWDGSFYLRGGDLASDVLVTANEVVDSLNGIHGTPCPCQPDLPGYVAATTLHNGGGNRNCRADGFRGKMCYGGGFVPTRWRLGNKCAPLRGSGEFGVWSDSIYALAGIDADHSDMDVIFKFDAGIFPDPCGSLWIPPNPRNYLSGALTMAYALHNYIINGAP
jgi:hypothetical protein